MIEQILEFRGKTKTQKVLDEVGKIYSENLHKEFPEYFSDGHSAKAFSIVTTLKNKDEINNIGMSKLDDLLGNNFAKFIGAVCLTEQQQSMQGIGGASHPMRFWGRGLHQWTFNNYQAPYAGGMFISYGSGTNIPLRSDFRLQTSLQSLTSGNGGYSEGLGKVTMPSGIVSTQNATISETGLFGSWTWSDSGHALKGSDSYLLSRDLIDPVVPVVIGEQINIDYEILLN